MTKDSKISDIVKDTLERAEQAQMVIDTAIALIRSMGYGVVANGTVHGNGIWLDTLRVVRTDKPLG